MPAVAHNLEVGGDMMSDQEMLDALGDGLIITDLMGQGVNGVTGDYSRGAAGFWVEKGEIIHPVNEATIAGNFIRNVARHYRHRQRRYAPWFGALRLYLDPQYNDRRRQMMVDLATQSHATRYQ